MIPIGFAILTTVAFFFMGYAIGSIIEHNRSQEEIDVLTRLIEVRSEEALKEG